MGGINGRLWSIETAPLLIKLEGKWGNQTTTKILRQAARATLKRPCLLHDVQIATRIFNRRIHLQLIAHDTRVLQ